MVLIYILLSFCWADPLHEETPLVISNTTCWVRTHHCTGWGYLLTPILQPYVQWKKFSGPVKWKFANWSEKICSEGKHLPHHMKREGKVQMLCRKLSSWSVQRAACLCLCLSFSLSHSCDASTYLLKISDNWADYYHNARCDWDCRIWLVADWAARSCMWHIWQVTVDRSLTAAGIFTPRLTSSNM